IHGFLGKHYGVPTQKVAAIATTAGYVINGGFEIFWSSFLLAQCLGRPDLALVVALGLAGVVGVYCTIGGYRSNATVDKPHNILGVTALAALVWLVTDNLQITGPFRWAVNAFALGSAVYVLVSLLLYVTVIRQRYLTIIALTFAVLAFV